MRYLVKFPLQDRSNTAILMIAGRVIVTITITMWTHFNVVLKHNTRSSTFERSCNYKYDFEWNWSVQCHWNVNLELMSNNSFFHLPIYPKENFTTQFSNISKYSSCTNWICTVYSWSFAALGFCCNIWDIFRCRNLEFSI